MRWGLAGGSDIAATRMIPAMRALGQPVSAVASSSLERAEAFAATHSIPAAVPDVRQLVAREDVDAVYICTLNRLHGEHTLLAAAAGKHVLCEKPVAMDLAEAWSMVRACEAAGVVFGVNHHLPAHTTHAEIRRLVADGAVGRPMSVRVFFAFELAERLRGWRLTDADLGGPNLDLMPHVASVVNKLVGLPLDASAMAVRQGMWAPGLEGDAEDRAMSVVRYTGDVPGDVLSQTDLGWTTPYARNGLEVHGTEGSLVATNVMRADPGGSVTLQDSAGVREIAFTEHRDAYEATLEAFARAVTDGGDRSISGLEALNALAVTLAVKQAGVTRRTVPIDLEPPG